MDETDQRAVLDEIPWRIRHRRTSINNDELSVLTPSLVDSSINNIPLNYLSPTPSPDEIIIKQRGRRRIKLTWSPDKIRNSTPRTPTKIATTPMNLRSSPRKRFLFNDASTSTVEKTPSPNKSNTPNSKHLHYKSRSIGHAQQSTVPLNKLLKGLTNDQLFHVIENLVQNKPELESEIRTILPMPDLHHFEHELNAIKKYIFKCLPASRLVKKTDSSGYSRASIHLTIFKKTITDHCTLLHDAQHWNALLDYIQIAWNYVKSTPIWDNPRHNAIRKYCFKILSFHCLDALKFGDGGAFNELQLIQFSNRLSQMGHDAEEILLCETPLHNILSTFQRHNDESF